MPREAATTNCDQNQEAKCEIMYPQYLTLLSSQILARITISSLNHHMLDFSYFQNNAYLIYPSGLMYLSYLL